MAHPPRTGFLGRDLVLTPDGLVAIDELRTGDRVIGRDVTLAGSAPGAFAVLETHQLPDARIGAFEVGDPERPEVSELPAVVGEAQTFWVPADAAWTWDFSSNADEPEAIEGTRIAYDCDRTVWAGPGDGEAWLEWYRGSDEVTRFTLDARGVQSATRLVPAPPTDGSERQLRWTTHHLTVDGAHAFYATADRLLARDFAMGVDALEGD